MAHFLVLVAVLLATTAAAQGLNVRQQETSSRANQRPGPLQSEKASKGKQREGLDRTQQPAAQVPPGLESLLDESTLGFLQGSCGADPAALPAPGSLGGFMGPVLHANTSQTSYAYYRFGNASSARPPLVLIAGHGNTASFWPPSILRQLAQQGEVVVYDNPGVGFSQRLRPGDPLSIEGMAADALELFGLLGLSRPHIAGVSMGGMIAVAMAAEHGELVGRVVVAPGSAGSLRSRLSSPAFVQQVLSGRATKLDWLSAAFPLDTDAGVSAACWYLTERAGAVLHPSNEEAEQLQLMAILNYWTGPGVYDLLEGISNPMLLVGGQQDYIIPPQVRRPELHLFPAARHGVLAQEREALLPIVDRFLGKP